MKTENNNISQNILESRTAQVTAIWLILASLIPPLKDWMSEHPMEYTYAIGLVVIVLRLITTKAVHFVKPESPAETEAAEKKRKMEDAAEVAAEAVKEAAVVTAAAEVVKDAETAAEEIETKP